MGADPFSGAVHVFRAKRTDRIKLIFWHGVGSIPYSRAAGFLFYSVLLDISTRRIDVVNQTTRRAAQQHLHFAGTTAPHDG
ncbi:transposase [Mesorhizobium sp. LMG 17147]|uniref:transposase n=1 Tax=Mesorhizobium sp. LMG 17147 TaxID=2963091 RepID=UPI0020C9BA16|nr:transposase [Mesorhizobium sp. LMG 17147]MCP9234216.1 transposase [Mesorhizobium sp. LMG 17147]